MSDELRQRADEIRGLFREWFGAEPEVTVQAPGRVNLIGEHTDYNDGFVFPMAIERSIMICGRRRNDARLVMHQPAMASMHGSTAEASLEDIVKDPKHRWANYILGVARELLKLGCSLCGAELVIAGNVPIGSGLSSSAAIEVATATFFEALCGLEIAPKEVALLCQRAENQFVGVNCGIMDMFISTLGHEGHALMIDCRSLEYTQVPFDDPDVHVVVADTGVRRGLVSSEYNVRRAECEQGARLIGKALGKPVAALRDVCGAGFRRVEAELADPVRKRCRHVVTENERVVQSVAALEAGDWRCFGRLLNESHVSLRDDYEVSCDALNLMTDLLRQQDGVLGARMTGAGFGGCAIGVFRGVDDPAVQATCAHVAARYRERTGVEPSLFPTRAAAGAGVVRTET
ncbi:MAG: galactokinase [Verrucomicrobia bacterium]|nr:galactokinase [Verrucomicrobiota bacterium]